MGRQKDATEKEKQKDPKDKLKIDIFEEMQTNECNAVNSISGLESEFSSISSFYVLQFSHIVLAIYFVYSI